MNLNGAHLHLLVNHFPICTLVVSTLVLIVGLATKCRSTTNVALGISVLAGIFTLATFYTGDSAAEVLKQLPNFQKEYIHEHDQAADFALWAGIITAAVSAGGLYFSAKKKRIPKPYLIIVILIHLWALSVFARTSYLGGLINHPEVREQVNG